MSPHDDLFTALLRAPDRDAFPCARPILSWREDDDDRYLDQIEQHAVDHYVLERREAWHGRWSEFEPEAVGPRITSRRRLDAMFQRRWHLGQPVVLPAVFPVHTGAQRRTIKSRMRLFDRLAAEGSLAEWLGTALAGSEEFGVGDPLALVDPERDLERVAVACAADAAAAVWVKRSRLSTAESDASLRVRFSFGAEGPDDVNPDRARHQLVRALAERVLPEAAAIATCEGIGPRLDRLCAGPVTFSQHIAYWNAPGGGALFHHDAFDEAPEQRQLGVCFVQLAGRTAWLALSIDDLAARVAEFFELMDDGELAWVREALEDAGVWDAGRALAKSRGRLLAELAEPGCGQLASVVNRGPEFTSFLADAGHAAVLRAGDAILLPNHGLACTAMHSVFCASQRATYGLSLAVRGA